MTVYDSNAQYLADRIVRCFLVCTLLHSQNASKADGSSTIPVSDTLDMFLFLRFSFISMCFEMLSQIIAVIAVVCCAGLALE